MSRLGHRCSPDPSTSGSCSSQLINLPLDAGARGMAGPTGFQRRTTRRQTQGSRTTPECYIRCCRSRPRQLQEPSGRCQPREVNEIQGESRPQKGAGRGRRPPPSPLPYRAQKGRVRAGKREAVGTGREQKTGERAAANREAETWGERSYLRTSKKRWMRAKGITRSYRLCLASPTPPPLHLRARPFFLVNF